MARLSQLFAPREREFFDLFEEAGTNLVRAAELLERMLDQWPDHGELGRDVGVCELPRPLRVGGREGGARVARVPPPPGGGGGSGRDPVAALVPRNPPLHG